MNDQIVRLKQDLETIQTALGMDIWTRRDVRRGFLGAVGGAVASLFLALWMFYGGAPEIGMLIYVVALQAIIILKAIGYGKNPAPSPGTQREVGFYQRYYFAGAAIIGGYYFWGQRQGMDIQGLFASIVVMAGMWYVFYGLSSPSRSLSLAGAVPLLIGGFVLPEAQGMAQMFSWLGLVAFVGCGFEAALLLVGARQRSSPANPTAPAQSPTANPPEGPMPVHVAH